MKECFINLRLCTVDLETCKRSQNAWKIRRSKSWSQSNEVQTKVIESVKSGVVGVVAVATAGVILGGLLLGPI